jgi:hypothetical protein
MVGDSVAEIDPVNMRYHWKFVSGTSATSLNKELVYDIKRNKWFEIDRGTAKDLQNLTLVQDTNGNNYIYGFLDTGYMLRLEYGTSFDGVDITHVFQIGDIAPMGLAAETMLETAKLITVAKTVTANSATLTHYADGATSGTDITMSPARTGYRIAQPLDTNQKLLGDPFHSFKCSMTTNNETIGFEPLVLVIGLHKTSED